MKQRAILSRTMGSTIALVGPGRVGQTLARGLHRRGYRIVAVVGSSARKAGTAAAFIGGGKATDRSSPALLEAGTVLLAVPDAQIAPVAKGLARWGGSRWRGRLVLHTSGSRTARELAPLARVGARCGSFHPLFSFPRPLPRFPAGVFFGVEGHPRAVRRARELAKALRGIPLAVPSRHKVLYHTAAALASGHALTLVDLAARLLERAGIPKRQAQHALLPLVRSTLDEYERLGAYAWTGPLARGDFETVWKHLGALEKLPAYFLQAYGSLGRAGVKLYRKKALRPGRGAKAGRKR